MHYFRGQQFHKLVLEHAEAILAMLKLNTDIKQLASVSDSIELGNLFVEAKLIVGFQRNPNEPKWLKYPKTLLPFKLVVMTEDNFYAFNIKKKERGILYVVILASLVVLLILYPMWPYPIKLGIFYIVFAMLVFLIFVNIAWLVCWTVLWIFGVSFWIFPRLYDDSAGFFGSWVPLYSISWDKESGIGMLIFWIMSGILLILCAIHYA